MIYTILTFIEWIAFILNAISAIYLFVFSIASLWKKKKTLPNTNQKNRFLVLFPAYAEDNVIVDSIRSFMQQDYPNECYTIAVISDHMKEETNTQLEELPIKVIYADYANSSKAKALKLAISKHAESEFDCVVILDADNKVNPDFLTEINKAKASDMLAIQAHRQAKNYSTNVALLDAMSEEINNSIFRSGHQVLGLSSALIGSGMAIDYNWFYNHVNQLFSAGEDKELEAMLLLDNIRIHYLENIPVFDEKVEKSEIFRNQRRRWLAAQLFALQLMSKSLLTAIKQKNIDYCDKTFQQALLPRILNLLLIVAGCIITTLLFSNHSIKWWCLLALFTTTMIIAIPSHLKTGRLVKAFIMLPKLCLNTIINLFHLKGAAHNFIHTSHS